MNLPVVAFVGLGSMGLGMAKNLLKHGHKVIGVDPSGPARDAFIKAGGSTTSTPAEAAKVADVVVVAVVNAQGRTFMPQQLDNPFPAARDEVERLRAETPVIFVDMHAEATSEKIAMARFLDGQVSAVVGTHTHVQTADEKILPGGTAFLCDAGMCGPEDSILGREPKNIVQRFLNGMPAKFPVARGPVRVCGALVEVDEKTGRALAIRRISRLLDNEPD